MSNVNDMTHVNNLVDALQYDEAKSILFEKIKEFPNDTEILDTLSEVLIALNETKQAIEIINKSIQIEPNKNAEKYMSLGQLSEYKISLKCYKKGIEIYLNELNFLMQNPIEDNIEKINKIKSDLASAYSTIAELYMDSDLCFEKEAESICEESLKEAFKYQPDSIDALLQLSNLRILRCRDDEAKKCMDEVFGYIDNIMIKNINPKGELPPSNDIIMNLAKNYSELKIYEKAVQLYDLCLKINEEDLEIWYLTAFNHFQINNFKASLKCLENLKKVAEKLKVKNKVIEEASNELYNELMKIKNKKGVLTDSTKIGNENLDEKYDLEEDGMNID